MEDLKDKCNSLCKENTALTETIADLQVQLKESLTKIAELELHSESLKNRIRFLEEGHRDVQTPAVVIELENKLKNLMMQNKFYKLKLENETDDGLKSNVKRFMKDVKTWCAGLLGYKIDFENDTVILHSMYAFEKNDVFVFKLFGSDVEMAANEFTKSWEKEIQMYIGQQKSIPAFLAHVTLDLQAQKTFGN